MCEFISPTLTRTNFQIIADNIKNIANFLSSFGL